MIVLINAKNKIKEHVSTSYNKQKQQLKFERRVPHGSYIDCLKFQDIIFPNISMKLKKVHQQFCNEISMFK